MSQADLISRGIKNKNKICSFSFTIFFFLESDTFCIRRNGYDRINKKTAETAGDAEIVFLFVCFKDEL